MANSYNTRPLVFDTDFSSFRTAASATSGIRVEKLVLAVGGSATSTAGTVTIKAPDGITLYPPMAVPASQAEYSILFNEPPNVWTDVLTWRDFAVTGLTATGTVLYIWAKD